MNQVRQPLGVSTNTDDTWESYSFAFIRRPSTTLVGPKSQDQCILISRSNCKAICVRLILIMNESADKALATVRRIVIRSRQ